MLPVRHLAEAVERYKRLVLDVQLFEGGDADDGLAEGAYVDPDGNLLRFGSPLPGQS